MTTDNKPLVDKYALHRWASSWAANEIKMKMDSGIPRFILEKRKWNESEIAIVESYLEGIVRNLFSKGMLMEDIDLFSSDSFTKEVPHD